jgi:hypothetical protein
MRPSAIGLAALAVRERDAALARLEPRERALTRAVRENTEAERERQAVDRRQSVWVMGAVAFAQIGIVGFDGAIELEALRLYGLPNAAPAVLAGPTHGWGRREIPFSAAYDPPSLAAGASHQTIIAVAGAVPGDAVQVGFSVASTAVVFLATIGASGTVTVVAWNRSGSNVDLAAGMLFGQELKPGLA